MTSVSICAIDVQVLLQYMPSGELAGLQLGAIMVKPLPIKSPLAHAKFELSVNINGAGGMSIDYMAELFELATIERLAASYIALLGAAADRPLTPVDSLAIMGPTDRQLLSGFCAGELRPKYLSSPPVHDVVAAVATRHPESPALVFEGRTRRAPHSGCDPR